MIELYFFYITIISVVLLSFFILHFSSSKKAEKKSFSLSEITVLIPFKNEEKKLPKLLSAMEKQHQLPKSIIFIDDHSSDNSVQIIKKWVKHNKGTLIQLESNVTGKKRAIRKGVEISNSTYCLTLDADTWFQKVFFYSIEKTTQTDLQIRPVVMEGKTWISRFFSTEHLFFNAFVFLASPFYNLTASGANLIFNKKLFQEYSNLESNKNIASGDDHFLLRDFQKQKLKIHAVATKESVVFTNSPTNWSDYFNQRSRWLGKTKKTTRFYELILGLFIAFYFLGGFFLIIGLLVKGFILVGLSVFLFRIFSDLLVYLFYSNKLNSNKNSLFILLFQMFYPLVFLVVLITSFIQRNNWKK